MRVPLFLKILFTAASIYLSFYLNGIDSDLNERIRERNIAIGKLRGDPRLDEAENKKRYAQARTAMEQEVNVLEKQRHPAWYRNIALLLSIVAGFSLKNVINSLRKKRKPV